MWAFSNSLITTRNLLEHSAARFLGLVDTGIFQELYVYLYI